MDDASTLELLARLAISLGLVLGLMVLIARFVRRRGGMAVGRGTTGDAIEVIARRGLSRGASVAIVRAGGRTMVLGVTEQQVTHLGDTSDVVAIEPGPEAEWTASPGGPGAPPASSTAWKAMLDQLRERTVRRG